jgi:hypothetical protein
MTTLLKNCAVRIRITPETCEERGEIFSGVIEFNTIASETFSARVIKLSDYCAALSGDAYVMHTSSGTYGTRIEFLSYEILLGLYGDALSRDYSVEIKHGD